MTIDVLSPVGVRVAGLSVADVDDDTVVRLRDLLARHGVAVLPEQHVDDVAFTAFLERFGELTFTTGETPVPGFPDLNVVSNVGRTTPPRSSFHVDTSYVRVPPAYTALRAVQIPAQGGETLFSNQYRAYETLPDRVRTRLAGRTITHVVTGVDLGPDDEGSAEHPVFRPHPVSGRTALYLSSPARCASISGLPQDEADELVGYLYAHSTAEHNVYRHRWSPGDVVMWDNGCVLHRADHGGVVGDRVMHRGMVAAYAREGRVTRGPVAVRARTLATLALLTAVLPVNLAVTGVVALRNLAGRAPRANADRPRTVLISGGKMTKALQLARSFHRAGHRVILVEQAKYRLTGHRFSTAVDRFVTVPAPTSPDYAQALLDIVRSEGVDVYVPVCSPVASYYDALAKPLLEPYCEVIHCDADMIEQLDDKDAFAAMAAALGLSVPDSRRITDPSQVEEFDFRPDDPPYVLKSIPYDPVHRLDLTPLPRPTAQETAAYARSKPMTPDAPWIMQEFVTGQEYCTHSTVRNGVVQVYCCCPSSAFQINYEMVDRPAIEKWVRTFVAAHELTGQVSFDFIEAADGTPYAIECNPRTHSAITMFYDHPDVARAYLDDDVETVLPTAASRPTYWIYHEIWRLVTEPGTIAHRLRTIARGKDAIFDWSDPWPFLLVHHLQIPSLLLHNLRVGKDWIRIDFNIGKLVEAAGD